MALDFPNPTSQTPANTFSPTSTPSASTNGITYTWDGVKWTLEVESDELLNYWDRDSVQQHLLPRNFDDLLRFKALGIDYLAVLP